MKSLLCWSQWQHSHLFGSSHNFMLYILLRLNCNQSFFVAPVSSRLFPDFGTPKMTKKNNKTGATLGRKVLLEEGESLWRNWRRKSDTDVRTLCGVSSRTEEQRMGRAVEQ